jgi:CRISPR-associated protein Csm1
MAADFLLAASSRIALTALLHDLGKLAERAGIDHAGRLDAHKTLFCPWHEEGKYHSHVHAAYTGIAWDALEASGHFPDLRRDSPPFAGGADDITDSAVNAASAHHRPGTFLQWCVATADRVASGFERDQFEQGYNRQKEDNHYRARLLTLFEQIGRDEIRREDLAWRYPLAPLSADAIFPSPAATCTPKDDSTARAEYHALWDALLAGLQRIPKAHVANLPLWLDHFDSLWLTVAHAIPAATAFGVKPEVSLYDHSKATAALATALWRWHYESGDETVAGIREGWDDKKILLVQGDFFGIQDFIFAAGGATQKHAHKLLRGRSFQVALLAECAALKVLEALSLPSTSQIINAAGKFLIVAPDTAGARTAIERCRAELDAWCLARTYGEIGVGIAATAASCNDFTGGRFAALNARLFAELDIARHRRFDLCGGEAPAVFDGFLDAFDNALGVCAINGRYPATRQRGDDDSAYALCDLADDQIRIGEALTKKTRLLVTRDADTLSALGLDYFGYRLSFVPPEDESGKYGQLAHSGILVRAWDFDAPEADGTVWRGYARRFVNAYVPTWSETDAVLKNEGKYQRASPQELGETAPGRIKTLATLALEDGWHDGQCFKGEVALVTLKGDIDDLGALFQKGLAKPSFAKMASLSRQINAFFALWLPWYCEHGRDATGQTRFANTYTVFAGGDDFFLIGPWESTLALAGVLHQRFAAYVANPDIHFSAGIVMSPPKLPIRHLAGSAEAALECAKAHPGKNAASLWQRTLPWSAWNELVTERRAALEALMARAGEEGARFSTGLTYSLLQLSDRAESRRPEDAVWRSQLHYRLARYFRDRVKGDPSAAGRRQTLLAEAIAEIGGALGRHKGAYRIPLSVLLYRQRE